MSSASKPTVIQVCQGYACKQNFAQYTLERAEAMAAKDTNLKVETCGCRDNCKKGPTVVINGKIHSRVNGVELKKIIGK